MRSAVFIGFALRQATASDFSARCSATRTATSRHRRAAPRSPRSTGPPARSTLTMSRARGGKLLHQPLDVASAYADPRLGRGEHGLEILDRLVAAHAAPAHRVDDLVARDRVDPGRQPEAAVPGLPLQMDRQQSLLHDILDIRVADPGARESAPRHRPHRAADLLEQTADRPPRRRPGRRASCRAHFSSTGLAGRLLAHSSFAPVAADCYGAGDRRRKNIAAARRARRVTCGGPRREDADERRCRGGRP